MTKTIQSPKSKRQELGGGIYSLHELRTYLAFSGESTDGDQALYWLTSALNPVAHRPHQPDYAFSDLVSLFVVRELLRLGVKPSKIKDAEQWLRDEWKIDRPFVSEDIKTDGVEVFHRDQVISEQIEAASRKGQQAMREAVKDKLVSVKYTDGTATSWEPVEGIVLNPQLQFGSPTIAGSRLPTEIVAGVGANLGIVPLLFDEGLPASVAEAFRVLRLNAHAIGDGTAPDLGSSDKSNCEWCKERDIVLITNDLGKKDKTIFDHLAENQVHAIFVYNDLRFAADHHLACAVLKSEKRMEEVAAKRLLKDRLCLGGGLLKRS